LEGKRLGRKMKNNRKTLLQTGNRSLITHRSPKSSVSEQYRTVRTNIEFAAVDESLRTFMVTSANPSEGKSTTVANLAVVFAQQDKKVLLVDGDMRRPTVHYTFRTDNIKGLTNVLTKQATLEEVACETEVNNLHVVSCGPIPPNPAELLSSKAMDQFIEEALKSYDVVIFDTPPVLAVTDAQVLANKVQGVILVVNSGKTETELALKTKELLTNAKAKLLGVVLNEKKQKQGEYYYYYGRR
jgi:protein-tyrosine kinase